MRPVLFDTSVYIDALRTGNDRVVAIRRFAQDSLLWLSAVVLQELYAGVAARDRKVIERLERDFTANNRVLVPNLGDWVVTGNLLAQLGERYGYDQIGQGRLTNDALIATSAGRMGVTVITTNPRDFARLAQLRTFSWQLGIFS